MDNVPGRRPRLGLNLLHLNTASNASMGPQGMGTPASAVVSYSAMTPIQPYNPQEWVASPAVGPERPQYISTEPPVPPMSLPPPPYSPPRQRPAGGSDQPGPTSDSTQFAQSLPVTVAVGTPGPARPQTTAPSPAPMTVPRGDAAQNPAFPPPPPARGGSRERRFGLSTLMRRRDAEQASSARDTPVNAAMRPGFGPVPNASISTPTSTASAAGHSPAHRPLALHVEIPHMSQGVSPSQLGPESAPLPPGARRAASASAAEAPASARPGSGPQSQWASHRMTIHVPPPPRGPPPSQSRPQSIVNMTGFPDVVSVSLGSQPSATSSQPNETPFTPAPRQSPGLSRASAIRSDRSAIQSPVEGRIRPQVLSPQNDVSYSPESTTPRAIASAVPAGQVQQSRDDHPLPGPPAENAAKPSPRAQARDCSMSSSQSQSILTPCESVFSQATKQDVLSQNANQFCQAAIERFRDFAVKEAGAKSDVERVRLFADFFVSESRIRRERYATSISTMGSEVLDLTRDLFRPMNPESRRPSQTQPYSQGEWTPQSSKPATSHRSSMGSIPRIRELSLPRHASAPVSRDVSPSASRAGPSNPSTGRAPLSLAIGSGANNSNYMPCLSPILSQSVSDNHDGENSRGRPASRWWESDSAGRDVPADKRTKRESKYMGLPREQWAEQWADAKDEKAQLRKSFEAVESPEALPQDMSYGQPYQGQGHSWQDGGRTFDSWTATGVTVTPSTPQRNSGLDVSRLVSLPPPYPRHHPAVSNSHPELAETRSAVRTVSDLSELKEPKENFISSSRAAQQAFEKAALERKQAFRKRVQQDVSSSAISYAEAAAREQEFERTERDKVKEMAKTDFTEFQAQVVSPLHETLTARIGRVTDLFDRLASQLFDSVNERPDVLQEEGDDKPELLEKLTLLKWVFEAREALHRAVYDLLSDRNDRYRDVILTPYRLANNAEKIRSAGNFFAEDAAKRQREFDEEALQRASEFKAVVEQTVTKGVEVQMSAFWDIAPSLGGVLDQIPQNIGGLSVHIPPTEYEENPSYHHHPLQYLYSLLLHAQKSTYQFIESQTNLLCLLHEVKEAVSHAKAKVREKESSSSDGAAATEKDRLAHAQELRREQQLLTDDLKDKVREVQEQWNSALGRSLEGVKERVGEWLLQTGGWDETLEDVGPAGGVV